MLKLLTLLSSAIGYLVIFTMTYGFAFWAGTKCNIARERLHTLRDQWNESKIN